MLSLLFIVYSQLSKNPEIVYVDNNKLFDEFRMTKEMKKIGEKEFNSKKANLDSLYIEIQREDLSQETKENMMKNFVSKREEFDQFNQSFAVEESKKIWSRINSYIKDFSIENNYELILGSGDNRNILFANESKDITNDLLTYINKKYAGL
ncbi:MAG: OmpH family outer membrane protein [Flavobacterium sp.]|nr:OmpH family outer membrane protein [Flavobacterium sp.]